MSQGGLCALGQSSLQGLYDPDRIRQPLKRDDSGGATASFSPISWDEAYKLVGAALKTHKGKIGVLTNEVSGSMKALLEQFSSSLGASHLTYDPLQPTAVAEASEAVYGTRGVPQYHFEKADLVVNFGADFLETWVSPVGFARDWASTRTSKTPSRVIHIEPRLSLTGANADLWLQSRAGSESAVALFLVQYLLRNGKGTSLSPSVLSRLKNVSKGASVASASEASGISQEQLLLMAERLSEAKSSLVISGGAAASTPAAVALSSLTAFLNLILGNVGKTVDLGSMRKPESSLKGLLDFVKGLESGDQGLLLVKDSNPAFQLPAGYGFSYALRNARVKQLELGNSTPLMISFSSALDETAMLSDLILPSHHFLEDWGDANPQAGVYGLTQPSMTPVFDTRGFGDSLIRLIKEAAGEEVAPDYRQFVQSEWKKLFENEVSGGTFNSWWAQAVERGGYFPKRSGGSRPKIEVSDAALSLDFAADSLPSAKKGELVVYPFPSVKTFDGRAANRPWMQELPDPVTQAVWDAWGEVHPATAESLGVKQGDVLVVRTDNGELNLPVYITEHVHPEIVAVPLGQGHSALGRYAREVSEVGNAYSVIPAVDAPSDSLALVSAVAQVSKRRGGANLVTMQGSDSQSGGGSYNRGLAKTLVASKAIEADGYKDDHKSGHGSSYGAHAGDHEEDSRGDSASADSAHGGGGGGGGHHGEVKQMYDQRKHPLYEWAMAVDLAACTGCSACVAACYAENNIPVVGKEVCGQGREMSWLRIERYFDKGPSEELQVSFLPAMCQHCNNAPCEPVCPVYATYHNPEGLNVMVYNRCVGTRYCSNNCSYKQRRFNWFEYEFPEPLDLQLNPDVTKRSAGVMEKCTFCVQRIAEAKDQAKDLGRPVQDGEVQPACVQSCPTKALSFGDINDSSSQVSKLAKDGRAYKLLDHHINTQPAVSYLENVKYKV